MGEETSLGRSLFFSLIKCKAMAASGNYEGRGKWAEKFKSMLE